MTPTVSDTTSHAIRRLRSAREVLRDVLNHEQFNYGRGQGAPLRISAASLRATGREQPSPGSAHRPRA